MEIIQILADIILALVVLYLGVIEKRISTVQEKLEKKMDKEDIRQLLDLEVKAVTNEQSNLKEDLHRIEQKVDKLLDKITKVKID